MPLQCHCYLYGKSNNTGTENLIAYFHMAELVCLPTFSILDDGGDIHAMYNSAQ